MPEIHSVEGLAAYAAEQIERIERMQREVAQQVGEGTSRQGHVKAKTGIAGAVKDLRIAPSALRLSPEELSAEVTSAIAAAQADYARKADDIMGPILGMRPSEDAASSFESRLGRLQSLQDDVERLARSRGLTN